MTEYFEELLAIILDTERSLNPSRLSELSDPTRENLAAFRAAWFEAPDERRLEISQQLHRLAEENIELLFERINLVLLEDPEPEVRMQAIDNLWESEDKDLAISLSEITRTDPDTGVRLHAAEALGKFIYLAELGKLPEEVRLEIEAALAELLIDSESGQLQRRALESLGYSSSMEMGQHIEQAYQSEEEESIRSSLIAMGRTANPIWREQIEAHLNNRSPRIRAEAARAVGEIQSRSSGNLLLDLIDDPKEQVRLAAIWSLGQIGGDQAREALEGLLEADKGDRQAIEEALEHVAFLDSTPDLMMFDLSPGEE